MNAPPKACFVVFSRATCGNCANFKALANEFYKGATPIVYISVDAFEKEAGAYGVRALPHLVVVACNDKGMTVDLHHEQASIDVVGQYDLLISRIRGVETQSVIAGACVWKAPAKRSGSVGSGNRSARKQPRGKRNSASSQLLSSS